MSGDRFGRRTVLIFTLLLMGISTFMLGLLSTYGQVGIMAPILLVIAQLLQGISAAGERAGANPMTLEHAPANQRAFCTCFTLSGEPAIRRDTPLARRKERAGSAVNVFDIRLQGDRETVFFDV